MGALAGQRRVDFLQKFFMYLIIIDWVLLIVTSLKIQSLNSYYGSSISALLIIYNAFLCHISFVRAKRSRDAYLNYPVSMGMLIATLLFSYFFIF